MAAVTADVTISPMVQEARRRVQGKTLQEAIVGLLSFGLPGRKVEFEKAARQEIQQNPIRHLFAKTTVSDSGKTVAATPAAVGAEGDEEADALRDAMMWQAALHTQVFVAGYLDPARRQILLEHPITERVVRDLLLPSPFVPQERENFFVRGLTAGFQGDFLMATHVLVPQLENSFRRWLDESGAITSSLDSEGLQKERDLNYLLYHEAFVNLVGENWAFLLQMVLVEKGSVNFRNLLAHGLLDDGEFEKPWACFIWWIALVFVALTRKPPPGKTETPATSNDQGGG